MSSRAESRTTAVVLFTRDLPVHDHPGLVAAARSSEYVIPVFVLDDDVLDRAGPNRIGFLVEALADLRESLRQRAAPEYPAPIIEPASPARSRRRNHAGWA